MEYVRRKIDNVLISWKLEDNRKPLLLRGARQVGKTSTVREFAKTFDYYIEIDLQKHLPRQEDKPNEVLFAFAKANALL